MLNQELIEREYGFLQDKIYVNTSLISMPPMRVQEAWKRYIQTYVDVCATNYPTYFPGLLEDARKELAKLLKAEPLEIAFTSSACASMTILANSFPFEKGDNVIITSEEHASNAIPWLALEKRGITVKIVESRGGCVYEEDLIRAIDEHTRIMAVASVFFCTGFALDVAMVGKACKERGVYLAVDATQSLGRSRLYPKAEFVDFIAGGAHKGLLGTKSLGYLYCSKELCKKMKPYTGSLQSQGNGGRPFTLKHYDEIEWYPGAERFEAGNPPYGVIDALGKGVSLINEFGVENIEAQIRETEEVLRGRLKGLPLRILEPERERRSGMLFVFYPEGADLDQVREILVKNNVFATVRYDYIRMTLHLYNSPKQMGRLVETLEEISRL